MREQKELQINNYTKYIHHISQLKDLEQRLEEMGIGTPDSNTAMWVYLQSFKEDAILTDKYIYNFGIMDEEMKKHVGEVFDYNIYLQTIVEMTFSEFKELYSIQSRERELLSLEYPGLIIMTEKPHYIKKKKERKIKTPEELAEQKAKRKKYQKEYYNNVLKKRREEKQKLENM